MTIDVQRFESIPGEAALIERCGPCAPPPSGAKRTGRTVARESVQGEGFDALAAAHSRALARLSARHRRGDPRGGGERGVGSVEPAR